MRIKSSFECDICGADRETARRCNGKGCNVELCLDCLKRHESDCIKRNGDRTKRAASKRKFKIGQVVAECYPAEGSFRAFVKSYFAITPELSFIEPNKPEGRHGRFYRALTNEEMGLASRAAEEHKR